VVSALGEIINDGVIHPEEKVKVKVRSLTDGSYGAGQSWIVLAEAIFHAGLVLTYTLHGCRYTDDC